MFVLEIATKVNAQDVGKFKGTVPNVLEMLGEIARNLSSQIIQSVRPMPPTLVVQVRDFRIIPSVMLIIQVPPVTGIIFLIILSVRGMLAGDVIV